MQVVQYLAGCGLQSCGMLVCKGYPDIGWNPVEGERYLDFLRFAVFCNGDCGNSVKTGLIDFLVLVGVNTVNSSALI